MLCHGVVSLLCAGYIKAGESVGRSDLTELHESPHSLWATEENYKENSLEEKKNNTVRKTIMVMCG